MSKEAWRNAKQANAILPAGKVTPSPKPYSPEGDPLLLVPDPTPLMLEVAEYAKFVARQVLQAEIQVTFAREPAWPYSATYGPGQLTFNVRRLGRNWFSLAENRLAIDELLIHEFGHHYSGDHLSDNYHAALCRIGAAMIRKCPHWKR